MKKRQNYSTHDRNLAPEGYKAFRYRTPYGWCMIAAKDSKEALAQVAHAIAMGNISEGRIKPENLQQWVGPKVGGRYIRIRSRK